MVDEEEEEDEAFTSLVSMLGGVGSKRALEVLSRAAGYHAPAQLSNAAASDEESLLKQLALGVPAVEEAVAPVSVEG